MRYPAGILFVEMFIVVCAANWLLHLPPPPNPAISSQYSIIKRRRYDARRPEDGTPSFQRRRGLQAGREIYESSIRPQVEIEQNIGRQIVIDVETGEYEVDEDGLAASRRLLVKRPDAALYGAHWLRRRVFSGRYLDAEKERTPRLQLGMGFFVRTFEKVF